MSHTYTAYEVKGAYLDLSKNYPIRDLRVTAELLATYTGRLVINNFAPVDMDRKRFLELLANRQVGSTMANLKRNIATIVKETKLDSFKGPKFRDENDYY